MLLSQRRERYRQVLAGDECVHPASVFDPISARIAESLGFEIGMFAGSIASATVLGAPDLVVLTLTEFAEQIGRITRGSNLSLMVDADHGYGNALNVMRTVEELETAGVSALTIEDTVLPLSFGGGNDGLISQAEMVGKLRSAVHARQDSTLVIIGRTAVLRFVSLEEAQRRIKAYAETGIDALFLTGTRNWEQLEVVRQATSLPLLMGGGAPEMSDRQRLGAAGVRIALQGHMPFYAGVKAVYDTLKHLRDGGSPAALNDKVASNDLLNIALKQQDYARWRQDYLQ
ncbi:MAG: isocitrate lyase/phosphoenolpyruvate mutase family protein [bacterium]|nr:isocitrate lyase/phosphoenolpyruvate mutase family protein [bacterium]